MSSVWSGSGPSPGDKVKGQRMDQIQRASVKVRVEDLVRFQMVVLGCTIHFRSCHTPQYNKDNDKAITYHKSNSFNRYTHPRH